MRAGNVGYRNQLDRTRRYLTRVETRESRNDVEYQDDVWSFFQNCWHLKDWVRNDPQVSQIIKDQIKAAVELPTSILAVANDMANGTKHLQLRGPVVGAKHSHVNITIVPGKVSVADCLIEMGDGTPRSALDVARECVVEWERVLSGSGLAIDRTS